jgi:general secretion pathway protein D
MFAKTLEFQYWLDPGVTGSVSLKISSQQMSRRELWQLLEDILWMNGAYMTRKEGYVHILPFKSMPLDKRLLLRHDPQPNVSVELLALRYLGAATAVPLIQPFLSQGATLQPVPNLNALLVVEQPGNLPKVLELIQRLDVLGETQWPMLSVQCYQVDAEVLAEELKLVLPTIGFPISAGGGRARRQTDAHQTGSGVDHFGAHA